MKKLTIFALFALMAALVLAAACSSGANTATSPVNTSQAKTNSSAINNATPANVAPKSDDDTPAPVKAAFPDAQSFTKQHKDLSNEQMTEIEKEAGAKLPDTDHHSYLAFSTAGGARKQVGAATVIKAAGKDFVIVYENKEGKPYIKEIRGEGVPAPFLAQFVGKGHDDKFKIGSDLKANGVDDAAGKALAQAVKTDILTMQTLYGAPEKH